MRCINAKLDLLKVVGYFRKNPKLAEPTTDEHERNELDPAMAEAAAQSKRQRRQGRTRHATSYTFINAVGALSREHDIRDHFDDPSSEKTLSELLELIPFLGEL